ncbi:MAG: RNA polymerase sigma factor RpoD/SigA [Acidobacteriota bacterium]
MSSVSNNKNSTLSRYFSEIREYPLLSKEEEMVLARKIKVGGKKSLNELIESNLSFVVKVASEYRNLGLPFEDLLNEGNVGLIEAAHRYDHKKGTKFITYAIWWIRKSILKALSEHASLVRVPNYQMKKVKELKDTEKTLRKALGRKPKREEISEHLERSISKIDEILKLTLKEISLDEKIGKDKDTAISDYLVDSAFIDPEEDLIKRENNHLVKAALDFLSEQERIVVTNRFGLNGGKILTLKEIGEMMNISRERVRQIESQAKARLKKAFAKNRIIKSPPKDKFPAKIMESLSTPRK